MRNSFDHEKLDVYQVAVTLTVLVDEIVNEFPKGRGYLADQLLRACTSVPLNIAEGAGEYSPNEKIRFYRMARRSATECAAILNICWNLKILNEKPYKSSRELLLRLVAMLTVMAQV